MLKIGVAAILFISLTGCFYTGKSVKVLFENSSDIKRSITIMSYLNDSLIDKRVVIKDTIADRYSELTVEIPKPVTGRVNFRFKILGEAENTSCVINPDSIVKNIQIHVNYVETIFRKGDYYESVVLEKDTFVQKDFYCEILN